VARAASRDAVRNSVRPGREDNPDEQQQQQLVQAQPKVTRRPLVEVPQLALDLGDEVAEALRLGLELGFGVGSCVADGSVALLELVGGPEDEPVDDPSQLGHLLPNRLLCCRVTPAGMTWTRHLSLSSRSGELQRRCRRSRLVGRGTAASGPRWRPTAP